MVLPCDNQPEVFLDVDKNDFRIRILRESTLREVSGRKAWWAYQPIIEYYTKQLDEVPRYGGSVQD